MVGSIDDDGLTISNPGGFVEGVTFIHLLMKEKLGRAASARVLFISVSAKNIRRTLIFWVISCAKRILEARLLTANLVLNLTG
ncbi:MAG: hypothetical protein AB1733_13030 [Thermodesulfobacteriota bacterium]